MVEKVNYEIERNREDTKAGSVSGTITGYLKDTVECNKDNLTLIRNLFSEISGEEYVESPSVHADIDEVPPDSIYGLVWIVHSQSLVINDIVKCIKERIG